MNNSKLDNEGCPMKKAMQEKVSDNLKENAFESEENEETCSSCPNADV